MVALPLMRYTSCVYCSLALLPSQSRQRHVQGGLQVFPSPNALAACLLPPLYWWLLTLGSHRLVCLAIKPPATLPPLLRCLLHRGLYLFLYVRTRMGSDALPDVLSLALCCCTSWQCECHCMAIKNFADKHVFFNCDLHRCSATHHRDASFFAHNALLDATGVGALPLLGCVQQQLPHSNRCSRRPPWSIACPTTRCQGFITPSLSNATNQHS